MIKNSKVVLIWFVSLIITSIGGVSVFALYTYLNNPDLTGFDWEFMLEMLFSSSMSALIFSVIPLITLLICNAILKRKQFIEVKYFKKLGFVFYLTKFISFLVVDFILFLILYSVYTEYFAPKPFSTHAFLILGPVLTFAVFSVWDLIASTAVIQLILRKELKANRLTKKELSNPVLDE